MGKEMLSVVLYELGGWGPVPPKILQNTFCPPPLSLPCVFTPLLPILERF